MLVGGMLTFVALFGGTAGVLAYHKQQLKWDTAIVQALPRVAGNPVVYMDIEDFGVPVGRLVIQLRADVVPRAAENFRQLCTGAPGWGYKTSPLFAVEQRTRVLGGDFYGNGRGGYSIYGDTFDDESFDLQHVGPGTVAMRSHGPNTNNSQFYITFRRLQQYDGQNQVVGYLVDGFDVLQWLDKTARSDGTFGRDHNFRIAACGQLAPEAAAALLGGRAAPGTDAPTP
jgi:peptidyl-prolyl isomerase F (cyclophilin D)